MSTVEPWSHWLQLNPAEWPLKRLFWSGTPPADIDWGDPRQVEWVIGRILAEGKPSDWRMIRWPNLWPMWERIPMKPHIRAFWEEFWREGVSMGNQDAVLTEKHREILRIAGQVLPRYGFELARGTGLAAGYLGHRLSEDLDLFTGERMVGVATDEFLDALRQNGLGWREDARMQTFSRLWVGSSDIKVELALDSVFHLEPSTTFVSEMPTRSLTDLAADKVLALFGRATTRDFVDVYWLQHTMYDWSTLMEWARQKDPGFDLEWMAKACLQVDTVRESDVTLLVPLDWDELRRVFHECAQKIIRNLPR